MKTLSLALLLLVPLALPTTVAESESVHVEMDADRYSAADTLTGAAIPQATVTVLDAEGAPVAGARVTLSILRQVQFVGYVSGEALTGTTGADGTATFDAPQNSRLPGTYVVVASALEGIAGSRYTIEV